jgi:hypothetical protein
LWQAYGCLNTIVRHEHNINLNHDSRIKLWLKGRHRFHVAKKSSVWNKTQVASIRLIPETSPLILLQKAAVMLGVHGGNRPSEIASQLISDIAVPDGPRGDLVVTISEESKTQAAGQHSFIVPDSEAEDPNTPAQIVRRYLAASNAYNRPAGTRVFRLYDKKTKKFTNRVLGKNTISGIPCVISTYLNLPEPKKYTGATFRRTAATILADEGTSLVGLKNFGRWKSSSSAEGYVAASKKQKTKMARRISNVGPLSPAVSSNATQQLVVPAPSSVAAPSPVVQLPGSDGSKFTITIQYG